MRLAMVHGLVALPADTYGSAAALDEMLAGPAVVAGCKNGESPVKFRRCRATVRHFCQARMPTREPIVVTTSFA